MPETLLHTNEIFVESSLHILNMAIFHCLTNKSVIKNKNKMSVQPHRTTSVKPLLLPAILLFIRVIDTTQIQIHHHYHLLFLHPRPLLTARHHFLLNNYFRIQNNHKGLYTRVLQLNTCTFCFDICFFCGSS